MNRKQYWYNLFNQASTNNQPLHYKVVQEYFGNEVLKIFASWFVDRRKELTAK